MKKNLWKLLLVSSFCAVGLGLNNGEKVNAMQQNPLGNGAGAVEIAGEDVLANNNMALMEAVRNNDLEMVALLVNRRVEDNGNLKIIKPLKSKMR